MIPSMNRRHGLFVALAGAAVVGAAGVVGGLAYFFSGSSQAPLTLDTVAGSPSSSASPAASSSPAALNTSPGTWVVASGSVAGYRVREQLASLSAPTDAVGRTSAVNGNATIVKSAAGYSVTAASFSVDVATLTSDRSMRDQRIREIGLQSDLYPTATFRLTEPITLPASVISGQVANVSATGRLTIHGVTRTVTIRLQAELTGSRIALAGSITFPFSEFGMTPPSIGGFVSVQNNATMEFRIYLQHQ